MNPQYMTQNQFGAPPQHFGPGRQGPGIPPQGSTESFNFPNATQPPFGYKGPSPAQNNLGSPSPNQMQSGMPPMHPTGQIPGLPPNPSQFPSLPSHQLPQVRMNGPTQGGPGQFQGAVQPPNMLQGTLQRPISGNQVGPMGPQINQMSSLGAMGPPPGPMTSSAGPIRPPAGLMGPPAGPVGPSLGPIRPPPASMAPTLGPMGLPTSTMGPPPGPMGPPLDLMSLPNGQMGPPVGQVGLQSKQMGSPGGQIGQLRGQMGLPGGQMGPTEGQMGPPGGQMGPPGVQMGPPGGQMGPPGGQMGPPGGQIGPTEGQIAAPGGQMGPPGGQMCPPVRQIGPPGGQMGSSTGQLGLPTTSMAPPTLSHPGQIQNAPAGQVVLPSGQSPTSQIRSPSGQIDPSTGQMDPPIGQVGPHTGQMGPPIGQMGPITGQGGPSPGKMGIPAGQMCPPTGSMGPPGPTSTPSGQMGPPPVQMVPTSVPMGALPGQMGVPSGPMGSLPGHMGPLPGQMGQQPGKVGTPHGQSDLQQTSGNILPNQMPPLQRPLGMPPNSVPPMGPVQNMMNLQSPNINSVSNFGPPKPAMSANQYSAKSNGPVQYTGIPPPVSQGAPNTPNQFGQSPNFPPLNSMGANQLTNQMSGMQISSERQYPGAPMKSTMNGDNSPHMPPPLGQNQGQYTNGPQNRGMQSAPGYPPMLGQQGQMPGGPYALQSNYQAPQQARRLDPDQMPSPIQVTQDDQRTRSGIFCTNQKGLVPPLVSTNFVIQDQGNASPRFIRSTMYNVPTTSDMMKQTAVPFGLVISPLARVMDQEYPPPIIDFGEIGPVRCIRCKAYMCPYMQFIDSGRRFQCLFCKATTEVPAEYFQHLDHTGQRMDRYERPELILGTYEFVATKDYCRNNTFPKPPAIIFVIDVSYNNMKSGLIHLLCAEMKEIIKHLPIDQGHEKSVMKVGFVTYNSSVHFYNIKGNLAQPQMMVVGDTHEMFMPLLDGFLCDIEESATVIDSLMEQIPVMFADTRETETVLLPAIQAGLEALKASECPGKLVVFHSTLPTADAPGRLKNRDDRKLLGTDKERTVLTPQTQAYNQLGMDCVAVGCSVDLFLFNNAYIDIATVGQVSRLSGGEVFKYTYFQADVDGHRLISDVITDISRPIAYDSIMRVRTSTGVRPTDFYGHFYMSNTTDMEIAAIDCDKAVAVEIKHDDKLTEEEGIYIQVALLYTSCSGQRRLRILNLSLKTCSQMADLYRSCELDTIVNFFAKQSIYRLLEHNPKTVKDSLVNRCAQMLACYRKNCASPSSAGQLILPECMKLLPLYVNCLLKSDALSGGSDITLDDRSFMMQAVTIMDIPTSVAYFYPRLIPLHEIQDNSENPEVPSAVRCTVEKMMDSGVYLLENGIYMLMWIGLSANPEWIQSVFGVPTAAQVNTETFHLPELDTSMSLAVRNIIDHVQTQRHRCMRLTLVKQRDKLETVFRHFLVEDRGQDGTSSYVDFLCHMHKEIRQLLS